MSKGDVALYATGGVLGMTGAYTLAVWLYCRVCEKISERGFGA